MERIRDFEIRRNLDAVVKRVTATTAIDGDRELRVLVMTTCQPVHVSTFGPSFRRSL